MTVAETPAFLRAHWPRIAEALQEGVYVPQPMLRRSIPKSDGGVRELGIPTVLDRLIQQAILPLLQPTLRNGRMRLNVAMPVAHFDALGVPRLAA